MEVCAYMCVCVYRSCRLKKKCTTYKLRITFYSVDKTEDLSPDAASQDDSEGRLPRGKGRARLYGSFCNKDKVVRTSKDYC